MTPDITIFLLIKFIKSKTPSDIASKYSQYNRLFVQEGSSFIDEIISNGKQHVKTPVVHFCTYYILKYFFWTKVGAMLVH